MQAIIEDKDVVDAVRSMNLTGFSEEQTTPETLRELLWDHPEIFKRLRKTKDVQHVIALKTVVKPVCEPMRRRLPKEEEVRKQAMVKLMNLGITKSSLSPWATGSS